MADAPRNTAFGRRLRASLALPGPLLSAALACGDGAVLVIGDRDAPGFRFDPPRPVEELSVAAKTDNPTLTADMLELYFTSERDRIPADVYVASRPQRTAPFGDVRRVDGVSTEGLETSPAVSADGLSLWVASDRDGGQGGLDIWVSRRAARGEPWPSPVNLDVLNSPGQDLPRPVGAGGRVMPMASDRARSPDHQIYFASRPNPDAPFEPPQPLLELEPIDETAIDAFLTDDGLTLFFVIGPAFGPADLYVAWRRTTASAFEAWVPLEDLNSPDDERDPWLSADGTELYFSSNRGGEYDIYVANAYLER